MSRTFFSLKTTNENDEEFLNDQSDEDEKKEESRKIFIYLFSFERSTWKKIERLIEKHWGSDDIERNSNIRLLCACLGWGCVVLMLFYSFVLACRAKRGRTNRLVNFSDLMKREKKIFASAYFFAGEIIEWAALKSNGRTFHTEVNLYLFPWQKRTRACQWNNKTSTIRNQVETQGKHYLYLICSKINAYVSNVRMLQLEAHSLLTSCLMNRILSTTTTIRMRFNWFVYLNDSIALSCKFWTCSFSLEADRISVESLT